MDAFIYFDEARSDEGPVLPDCQPNFVFRNLENPGPVVIKFLDPAAIEFMEGLPEAGLLAEKDDEQEDVPLGLGKLQQRAQLFQVLKKTPSRVRVTSSIPFSMVLQVLADRSSTVAGVSLILR